MPRARSRSPAPACAWTAPPSSTCSRSTTRQTRLQLDQGRIDIKTFTYDTKQPYEIVTPRGTVSLQQQGDYYVEAGTTAGSDPARRARRAPRRSRRPTARCWPCAPAKSARFPATAARRSSTRSRRRRRRCRHTGRSATSRSSTTAAAVSRRRRHRLRGPATPTARGATIPDYGQVWSPRGRCRPAGRPTAPAAGTTSQPYGWTWVDEQPWGFAPYHYGRWAQRNNRWFWVPPERQQRAVYAPALVAFVGGTELGIAIGAQNRAPVGWFPLGPREAYVPPYTDNRDYYRRLNANARVPAAASWTIAGSAPSGTRRSPANQQQFALMNRRFATVVPAEDFARSRPVQRAAIKVPADKLATAPVAAVSAPPAPTQSIRAGRRAGRQQPDRTRRRGRTTACQTTPRAAIRRASPACRHQARRSSSEVRPRSPSSMAGPGKTASPRRRRIREGRRAGKGRCRSLPRSLGAAAGQDRGRAHGRSRAASNACQSPPQPIVRDAANGRARPIVPSRSAGPAGQANLPPVRDRNEQRPEPADRTGQRQRRARRAGAAAGEPPRRQRAASGASRSASPTAPPSAPGQPPQPQRSSEPRRQRAAEPKPPQPQATPQPTAASPKRRKPAGPGRRSR